MNEEYTDMFSELSGHSSSKKYEIMAHVLFSFAEWTYEKWMGQQYADPVFLQVWRPHCSCIFQMRPYQRYVQLMQSLHVRVLVKMSVHQSQNAFALGANVINVNSPGKIKCYCQTKIFEGAWLLIPVGIHIQR